MEKFDTISLYDIPKLVQELDRYVHTIVYHCTATKEGVKVSPQTIETWHKNRKRPFSEIGYNLGINLDGTLVLGRDWNKIPAHVGGNNSNTLGIYYVGGLDKKGKPKDTRTPKQIETMLGLSEVLYDSFLILKEKIIEFKGHRDYSPDLNGNGIIESFEWTKSCPCFDVKKEIVDKL